MNILFDTNVILDVIEQRHSYYPQAALLMAAVEHGQLTGLLCATTVTTLFYLTRKRVGSLPAQTEIAQLLQLYQVAPVTHAVLLAATTLGMMDYEDAVLHESARLAGADGIVTRNEADFRRASMAIYTPEMLLRLLNAS